MPADPPASNLPKPPCKIKTGYIIFRRWDSQGGLSEITRTFSDLEELYSLCINPGVPSLLVDRILIEGVDGEHRPHTLTLVFQSLSQ